MSLDHSWPVLYVIMIIINVKYITRSFSDPQVLTWQCTSRPTSRQRPGAEIRETPTTVTQRQCTTAVGVRKRSKNRRRGGRSTCYNRTRSEQCPSRPEDVVVSTYIVI